MFFRNRHTGKWVIVALLSVLPFCAGLAGVLWAQDGATAAKPPQNAVQPEGPKAETGLLRENTRLIDREGRILCLKCDLNTGTVHRSVFQPRDGQGYLVLLENKYLEKVEDETRHGERDVMVSGTVTEYRGQNFLLLTRVFVRRVE